MQYESMLRGINIRTKQAESILKPIVNMLIANDTHVSAAAGLKNVQFFPVRNIKGAIINIFYINKDSCDHLDKKGVTNS